MDSGVALFSSSIVAFSLLVNSGYHEKSVPAPQSAKASTSSKKSQDEITTKDLFDPIKWNSRLKEKYNSCVYLDYNATTPVFPEVGEAMLPFLTSCFGNPSSPHVFSKPCREAVASARTLVGALVNAPNPSNTILFTSCGSESDNWAIDIAVHHFHTQPNRTLTSLPHVISCITEHPAILSYLRVLESKGAITLTTLNVDSEGFLHLDDLRSALQINTALVSIMHSNNEIGTLQPIRDISRAIAQFNAAHAVEGAHVLFHSDAAQSLGKVPVDVEVLGVDMLSIVGHKYGAPKGISALFVRDNIR